MPVSIAPPLRRAWLGLGWRAFALGAVLLGGIFGGAAPALAQSVPDYCPDKSELAPHSGTGLSVTDAPAEPKNLVVSGVCLVKGDTYYYGQVNIRRGGKLIFVEPALSSAITEQQFWASAIIIEAGGEMLAGVEVEGVPDVSKKAYGANGKTLSIHLYGAKRPDKTGASCITLPPDKRAQFDPNKDGEQDPNVEECGILKAHWESNGDTEWGDAKAPALPGNVSDNFYQYAELHGDTGIIGKTGRVGHFGYKVLALSYDGTLKLRGVKGTSIGADDATDPTIETLKKEPDALTATDQATIASSGRSWVRLANMTNSGASTTLTLDPPVGNRWVVGDEIIVTTTDYFPEHSEVRKIIAIADGGRTVTVAKLDYEHNYTKYPVGTKLGAGSSAFKTAITKVDGANSEFLKTAETRAAVGLLTRSIRIVSGGDKPKDDLADNDYFGGHVVFRQGFRQLQIQGVEFKQLGQGGRLGRYPVHFHMARRVPKDTYVIDSSVNESMTRWFVIYSTQGVTLARNIGYKSIGHGYFLEDGTEIDNKLYANLGVFARAAVADLVKGKGPNPRNVPGLLESETFPTGLPLKYHSDSQYPSVFWITNGWNSFVGNMAAGAGTCGACYWIPSVANHDMMDVPSHGGHGMVPMTWKGYANIQANGRYGTSPIRLFHRNSCTTAMHALNISDGSPCTVVMNDVLKPIKNTYEPPPASPDTDPGRNPKGDAAESDAAKAYYPRYTGQRKPTVCNTPDCSTQTCSNSDPEFCAVSTFSHFTTSFNWAEANFSAVWLRQGWLLFDHGFISDVLGAGITQVSGGDYSRPNLPVGYWALTSNSIFVGESQAKKNDYNSSSGPFPGKGCTLQSPPNDKLCITTGGSTAYLKGTANFLISQRLYNIYDGPAYQDTNAYLDIKAAPCTTQDTCLVHDTTGVRRAVAPYPSRGIKENDGYLPNAAIGWKQSNGFYYPPAFHSRNLFFGDVDIRHYVVQPLTLPGTYQTDFEAYKKDYAGQVGLNNAFDNWTDIDRQTELSDDDGTLTGFVDTVSVNEDPYFSAPVQASQCRSNLGVGPANVCAPKPVKRTTVSTARTSPYDHLTTVIYPGCAVQNTAGEAEQKCNETKDGTGFSWGRNCTTESCYGVPIYRQFLTQGGASNPREWERWTTGTCPALGDDLKKMTAGTEAYKTALKTFNGKCRFPFVRMAGVNGWQRSVMTANNGRYYIDTTASRDSQYSGPDLVRPGAIRSLNVFAKDQTYHVFFVFAKNSPAANAVTKQTYQIYVGPNFDASTVKGIRVTPKGWPMAPGDVQNWTLPWDKRVSADGVLTVEVDFSKVPATEIDPRSTANGAPVLSEVCKPVSFCKRDAANACQCDESKLGPLAALNPAFKQVCKETCTTWAVKDLDCPKDGCRGFSFTLKDGFGTAQDQYRRPKPDQFPTDDKSSRWNQIVFKPANQVTNPDAACNYDAAHTPNWSTAASNKCQVQD